MPTCILAIDIKRLCNAAGLPLSTQDVLSKPTIRQLAQIGIQKSLTTPSAPSSLRSACHRERICGLVEDVLKLCPGAPFHDCIETAMPCSPLQRRMYRAFHQKPEAPYLFNNLVELSGLESSLPTTHHRPSQTTRLLEAWQKTVQRHAILRTVFVVSSPKPDADVVQVVLKTTRPSAQLLHVDSCDDAVAQSRAGLATFRQAVFRNNLPPLSLTFFIANNTGKIYAHLILGHMLMDHVSLSHVMSDFGAFYRGLDSQLSPLSKGFGDYIAQVTQNPLESGESTRFWVEALRDVRPCTIARELRGRHPPRQDGPENQCPVAVGSVRFALDIPDAARRLCADARVTLSSLLQFAWATLLRRHTGNDAVCFGHLVSDRDRVPDEEGEIVGPVICLAVGRVVFADEGPVCDAMRALQDHSIAGLAHMSSFDLAAVEGELLGRWAPDAVSRQTIRPGSLFNTLINYRKVEYSPAGTLEIPKYKSIWKQDPHNVRVSLMPLIRIFRLLLQLACTQQQEAG